MIGTGHSHTAAIVAPIEGGPGRLHVWGSNAKLQLTKDITGGSEDTTPFEDRPQVLEL